MELQVAFGDEIKADSSGKVTGYLVRFGSADSTDLTGDFFTKDTDFGRPFVKGIAQPLNLYYAHGMDPKIGRKAVGAGTIKMDDVGLWFEAQIAQSDAYRKKLSELAAQKDASGTPRLGFSSGAAAHMVEREPVKDAAGNVKAHHITIWPMGEGSLTPRPAEPNNIASTKSLKGLLAAAKGWLYEDDEQVATRMTMAILRQAHDRLYSAFYDVICYQTAPREQRLASLEEALDEFEDICLRYATAVMTGAAPEGAMEAAESIKALRAHVAAINQPLPPADLPQVKNWADTIAQEHARGAALSLDVAGLALGYELALSTPVASEEAQ
jgi:phage head maturation protease